MKKTTPSGHKSKKVPRVKATRIVKFGVVASPIREQIIRAVEKVAKERDAARSK